MWIALIAGTLLIGALFVISKQQDEIERLQRSRNWWRNEAEKYQVIGEGE